MDKQGSWRISPAYDITYANGKGYTKEHQLSLKGETSAFDRKMLVDFAVDTVQYDDVLKAKDADSAALIPLGAVIGLGNDTSNDDGTGIGVERFLVRKTDISSITFTLSTSSPPSVIAFNAALLDSITRSKCWSTVPSTVR
jgi:hypothetical protein